MRLCGAFTRQCGDGINRAAADLLVCGARFCSWPRKGNECSCMAPQTGRGCSLRGRLARSGAAQRIQQLTRDETQLVTAKRPAKRGDDGRSVESWSHTMLQVLAPSARRRLAAPYCRLRITLFIFSPFAAVKVLQKERLVLITSGACAMEIATSNLESAWRRVRVQLRSTRRHVVDVDLLMLSTRGSRLTFLVCILATHVYP
ncbi:hypothetical protein HDK64DRAFT_149765 [Phyllosticta capitalensis]